MYLQEEKGKKRRQPGNTGEGKSSFFFPTLNALEIKKHVEAACGSVKQKHVFDDTRRLLLCCDEKRSQPETTIYDSGWRGRQ